MKNTDATFETVIKGLVSKLKHEGVNINKYIVEGAMDVESIITDAFELEIIPKNMNLIEFIG